MTEYRAAPEIAAIVNTLVAKDHTRLAGVRIECVWRDKAAKKNGKEVGGTARKVSGLNAFMARSVTTDVDYSEGADFFLIEIAEDQWIGLDRNQRLALVDHELEHCGFEYDEDKDTYTLGIRAHDVEAFSGNVERYGLWEADLVKFAESIKTQQNLFADDFDVDPTTGEVLVP